jgi:RNase P/RNase MRP subunit p30
MFDIIKCAADAKAHGFERLFSSEEAKGRAVVVENAEKAAELKNRKTLIMLQDWKFDEGAIKSIAEKKKACFLIDLSEIIKSRGMRRAVAISKLRSFLRLCAKHGAFYTFASFAEKEEEIRSPEELEHIIMLFDLNRGQARFALGMLKEYL